MNKLYPEELKILEDEIISIEEYDTIDTIDIELDSKNRLFFANDILTHNSGWESTDLNITNVSESAALLHTVDVLFGIITNAEMKARKEYYLKCLANRVAGYENTKKRYTIEWNYARIEEDKNAPIQDMDFVINSTVSPGRSGGQNRGGLPNPAAFIGSVMQSPGHKSETIGNSNAEGKLKDLDITGEGLF
jgi:hypothetical protein